MTSEELEEIFKGKFADTCANFFPACVNGGRSKPFKLAQAGSETHRSKMKLYKGINCYIYMI
jgi:hypothetical protein